uniref:FAD-dependent monooxygenase paxM n=1 Tax=Penicillium paxilli TaxID=70109 RepID=PAXM_PENPX|nr:RecName: Full=FAD-dependent monooxygenase paxM; AltName: Full=Paxilline synthesis protein M [Penicillium paxilli]AAK11530.1 PaxM [Penicillium paxilli]
MEKAEFQVIIVGGSIGGLTLAHCLHRAGIKHVVLEKASDPAPQIGASIGILPNGARVLDQLQLYDQVEEHIEPLSKATIGLPDGFNFSSSYPKIIDQRFGFPIAFLDRQKMLEILYKGYPDPSKIRLGQRVTSIESLDDGVLITTTTGHVYRGDLLVGADGVHSIVRREIWKARGIARRVSKIKQDSSKLTVEFRCIFGISSAMPGLKLGEQVNALFDGLTIVTIHGKDGRIYWFVIQKLGKKYVYPDSPRYTSHETSIAAEEIRDVKFYENITFGELWDKRETSSMTALEENTFKVWHHGRCVLLGDSVHKMTPNVGQGANMAIEDAAALANLLRKMRISSGPYFPTSSQMEFLLQKYRDLRYERVNTIYQSSRFLVRFQVRDGIIYSLLSRYWAPYAGDLPADMASKTIADGTMCDFLPTPKRSGGGWEKYSKQGRSWSYLTQLMIYLFGLTIVYTSLTMMFDLEGALKFYFLQV